MPHKGDIFCSKCAGGLFNIVLFQFRMMDSPSEIYFMYSQYKKQIHCVKFIRHIVHRKTKIGIWFRIRLLPIYVTKISLGVHIYTEMVANSEIFNTNSQFCHHLWICCYFQVQNGKQQYAKNNQKCIYSN